MQRYDHKPLPERAVVCDIGRGEVLDVLACDGLSCLYEITNHVIATTQSHVADVLAMMKVCQWDQRYYIAIDGGE